MMITLLHCSPLYCSRIAVLDARLQLLRPHAFAAVLLAAAVTPLAAVAFLIQVDCGVDG